MTSTNRKASRVRPILREAWDFDLDGCPPAELEHCCFYEYARESRAVRSLVRTWRKNRERLKRPHDQVGNDVVEMWFGSPFRVLARHAEFPRKHWLEIDPALRAQRVKDLPPCSRISWPGKPPVYEGPQPSDFTRLAAEQHLWRAIVNEKKNLLNLFLRAGRSTRSIRALPTRLRQYLTKSDVTAWRNKLAKLDGEQLQVAKNELRLACGKSYEKLRRRLHELVIYEIDWTMRPEELKERFGQWAEANRVHSPRRRGGGHATKAVELLRALGAKRLREWFRANWELLPKEYKSLTFDGALSKFTIAQRAAAGRPADPLYKTRKGLIDAEAVAAAHLQSLA